MDRVLDIQFWNATLKQWVASWAVYTRVVQTSRSDADAEVHSVIHKSDRRLALLNARSRRQLALMIQSERFRYISLKLYTCVCFVNEMNNVHCAHES